MTDHANELRLMADNPELSTPRREAAAWAAERIRELMALVDAAQHLRAAADPVSEWFCTDARHLEGPRIQAMRMTMIHYDAALTALKGQTNE